MEILHEDAEKGASIYPSITTHIPLHGMDHYPSNGGQEICAPGRRHDLPNQNEEALWLYLQREPRRSLVNMQVQRRRMAPCRGHAISSADISPRIVCLVRLQG